MTGLGRALRAVICVAVMIGAAQVHAQDMSVLEKFAQDSSTSAGALALAREQAASGDLTGAAATLERALLLDRQANNVRLAYAALLCRLDDPQGARLELTKLDGQPDDDAGWAGVQAACGNVARPKGADAAGGDGVVGEIAAGVAYDSDSLNALSPAFAAAAPTRSGLAFIGAARLDSRSAMGTGFVYSGLRALTKNSFSGPSQDYQLFDARIGYGAQSGGTDWSMGLAARHGRLGGRAFVTEAGLQTEIGFSSGAASRIAVRGEAVRQDYQDDTAFVRRSGWRYDLAANWTLKLHDDGVMTLGAGIEHKDAPTRNLGYTGGRLFFGIHLPVGADGMYFDGSSTLRYWDYHNVALTTDRREWRGFSRVALGLPVGPKGLAVEAAVSHSARAYNAASLLKDYSSFGAELRLVYRFGQGE